MCTIKNGSFDYCFGHQYFILVQGLDVDKLGTLDVFGLLVHRSMVETVEKVCQELRLTIAWHPFPVIVNRHP